jgi:hypothetical protein
MRANEKLTTEEIKNNLLLATDNKENPSGSWQQSGQNRNIRKIWEWAKGKLTREEINIKLLLDTDYEGWIIWQLAARRGR